MGSFRVVSGVFRVFFSESFRGLQGVFRVFSLCAFGDALSTLPTWEGLGADFHQRQFDNHTYSPLFNAKSNFAKISVFGSVSIN